MVYLFIFESIGTQELILIGIIAMIFLGPRKLPEYAKKIGKIMSEFRGTAQEFRTTWEREVNFEEEADAIRSGELAEAKPIPRIKPVSEPAVQTSDQVETSDQMIKTVDKDRFDELRKAKTANGKVTEDSSSESERLPENKRNWL